MQKPFEGSFAPRRAPLFFADKWRIPEAAYALRVGEMTTDIVDTDSGVHILLRTA